jgi:hypothetical protein
MNDRHDPFQTPGEVAEPPPAPKSRKKARIAPLLRELNAVSDDALAFLYGGPGQGTGDYERNRVTTVPWLRRDFTAFCEQHPHYANWRQAWATFATTLLPAEPAEPAEPAIVHVDFAAAAAPQTVALVPGTVPVQTSAPLWQQRARARATLSRHET